MGGVSRRHFSGLRPFSILEYQVFASTIALLT